jgi:uroporphyrinogen decarboxylase
MGQDLSFDTGHGPVLSHPVQSPKDLARLSHPDCERDLGYVGEAIQETLKGLGKDQTMIGFAGAPFTVASYMIEGQGSKNHTEVKKLRHLETPTFRGLLDLIAGVTIDYLLMQVRAGAECLMLFDTWAGQLAAGDYREFAYPATARVVRELKAKVPEVPLIYYPGQGLDLHYELSGLGVDVIAVDWRTRLPQAIRVLQEAGLDVSVQGNLDPQHLLATETSIRQKTRDILAEGRVARGHIFNVGHGLLPHTPPAAPGWVVDEIRKLEA